MSVKNILRVGAILALCLTTNSQLDIGPAPPTPESEAPDLVAVPRGLTFSCKERIAGYYADVEARCQVWHWCLPSGQKYSFICPPMTVFNQNYRVCDWWFNVDCAAAPSRYNVNEDLYKKSDGTLI